MTNWEKSCVSAIIAGNTAFSLFKLKQKNIQHLSSFINKIWPYKKTRNKLNLYRLSDIILNLKKFIPKNESDEMKIYIKEKSLDISNFFDIEYNKKGPIEITKKGNSIVNISVFLNPKDIKIKKEVCIELFDIQGSGYPDIRSGYRNLIGLDQLKKLKSYLKAHDLKEIKIQFKSQRKGTGPIINDFTKKIKKIVKKKKLPKGKLEKIGMNVGIEIEYDGINCQYLEKTLTSLGAVSFMSGWDGSTAPGSAKMVRLRENRLRLEGLNSLKALETLCLKMKETNCHITKKSGMHYHIDGTFVQINNFYPNYNKVFNLDWKWVLTNKTITEKSIFYIKDIFGLIPKEQEEIGDEITSQIRASDISTFEWRFGTATLNYSILCIEILASIHITNSLYKDQSVDDDYLKFLSEKQKSIRNKLS